MQVRWATAGFPPRICRVGCLRSSQPFSNTHQDMKNSQSSKPLSNNIHLLRWVQKMAALCKPDRIHWVDGSKAEYDRLCDEMVESGTLTRLNQKKWPGCFSAPRDDTARAVCGNGAKSEFLL
jgi:GTP-dependent phosphoenolpyruvate carboxykinase